MKRKTLFGLMAGASALFCSIPAQAQDYYLGQILLVPDNLCPRGTADASGQTLAISQNLALFSLFGTTFGGNGTANFALPDLHGRAPVHVGKPPSLATCTPAMHRAARRLPS